MAETVIVTGDSRGLGARIVETLLKDDNYDVVGVSRSETEQTDLFADHYPDRYDHLGFDLANIAEIEQLYQDKIRPHGPIYGLVNNAAMAYDDLVTNVGVEDLQRLFNVNVLSPIVLSKFALRDMMLNRTEGSLVHVSSVSTSTGYKGLSMYGATKGALESFSLGVAREWGPRGIRSNCVAPGFMNTDMTSSLEEEQKERIYDRTGLGQPTDEMDVAETVAFLLSGSAGSLTGEVIRIDSGTL